MMTSFDNNKDKVCSLFKNDVGESWIRSRTRSRVRAHNYKSRNHGVRNDQSYPIKQSTIKPNALINIMPIGKRFEAAEVGRLKVDVGK